MRPAGVSGRQKRQQSLAVQGLQHRSEGTWMGSSRSPPASSKSKTEPAEPVSTYGRGIVEDERCNRKVCPT